MDDEEKKVYTNLICSPNVNFLHLPFMQCGSTPIQDHVKTLHTPPLNIVKLRIPLHTYTMEGCFLFGVGLIWIASLIIEKYSVEREREKKKEY